jgi:ankyrin repeat protein
VRIYTDQERKLFDAIGRREDPLKYRALLAAEPWLVDAEDKYGETPLHLAADLGDGPWVAFLLAHGASPKGARGVRKKTPLHRAAGGVKENCAVVRMLIARGADPNAKDLLGRTPLHEAARAGFSDVAKVLLENGADAAAKNDAGHAPIAEATRYGHPRVAKLLQQTVKSGE